MDWCLIRKTWFTNTPNWLTRKKKTSNEVIIQDSPYKYIKETQFFQVLESLGNIRISCCKFFFEGEISKENFHNTSKFFIKYQIISNSFLSPLMFFVWISLTCSNKQHDTFFGSWQKNLCLVCSSQKFHCLTNCIAIDYCLGWIFVIAHRNIVDLNPLRTNYRWANLISITKSLCWRPDL